MISDERKQALIEGAFYQAERLNELRWLNSIFHNTLDGLPWRAQFQLSAVLERRVMEFEGGESKSGFRVGEGSDCTPADAGRRRKSWRSAAT